MLIDVSVTKGTSPSSFLYTLYLCESAIEGVRKIDLGVRNTRFTYALVYYDLASGWEVKLIPSHSLSEKAAEKLEYFEPIICKIVEN